MLKWLGRMFKNPGFSFWLLAIIFAAANGYYFYWFVIESGQSLSDDSNRWGVFGDFIGGVFNPLIALLAAFWIIKSFRLQQTEFREARESFDKARVHQASMVENELISMTVDIAIAHLNALNSTLDYKRESMQFVLDQAIEKKQDRFSGMENIDVLDRTGSSVKFGDIAKSLQEEINDSTRDIIEAKEILLGIQGALRNKMDAPLM